MIVIKLELWPGGNSDPATHTTLGVGTIANISDLAAMSSYDVRLLKSARYSSRPGDVWKAGKVNAFPRADRRWGPWDLLALALDATIGSRIEKLKRYLDVYTPDTPASTPTPAPISVGQAVKIRAAAKALALGSSPLTSSATEANPTHPHPLDKFVTTSTTSK